MPTTPHPTQLSDATHNAIISSTQYTIPASSQLHPSINPSSIATDRTILSLSHALLSKPNLLRFNASAVSRAKQRAKIILGHQPTPEQTITYGSLDMDAAVMLLCNSLAHHTLPPGVHPYDVTIAKLYTLAELSPDTRAGAVHDAIAPFMMATTRTNRMLAIIAAMLPQPLLCPGMAPMSELSLAMSGNILHLSRRLGQPIKSIHRKVRDLLMLTLAGESDEIGQLYTPFDAPILTQQTINIANALSMRCDLDGNDEIVPQGTTGLAYLDIETLKDQALRHVEFVNDDIIVNLLMSNAFDQDDPGLSDRADTAFRDYLGLTTDIQTSESMRALDIQDPLRSQLDNSMTLALNSAMTQMCDLPRMFAMCSIASILTYNNHHQLSQVLRETAAEWESL